MLKFVSVGLVVAAIGFACVETAQARHRSRWNSYCCCPSVATATAAPATVQSAPVPPAPTGQVAQSYEQTYQSYSADAVPPAPSTGVFNNSNDRGNEYRSFSADPVPPAPAPASSGVFNSANNAGNTFYNYNTRIGYGSGSSVSSGGTAGSPTP